jgi:hypothetical protein
MIQHDKHQYYFEKYLRNEMPDDERIAFDEKLADDAELDTAFRFYKSHRLNMLHNLELEHKLDKKDTRLNKLIFLLISLTGIALTFNYYLYTSPAATIPAGTEQKHRKPLYTYIPFVNWEKRAEKAEQAKNTTPKKDTAVTKPVKDEPVAVLEPSPLDEERTATDVFLTDSFLIIHDKAYIEQLLLAKKNGTDSMLIDSATLITPPRGKGKERTNQLFVEFWQSPVHYKGYRFSSKKLIVYGIELPYEIYVYRKNNALFLVHPYGETELTEQTNFQPF